MKKKVEQFLFIFILVSIISSSLISAGIMHSSIDIRIKINNVDDSINRGIAQGNFSRSSLFQSEILMVEENYSSSRDIRIGEHDASQIWISVQDGEMTLLNALSSTYKLCPNPSSPTTYSSQNMPSVYHTGMEIRLNSGITLQEAINRGDYCGKVDGKWGGNGYAPTQSCTGSGTLNNVPAKVTRICNNPSPINGGENCTIDTYRERYCAKRNWYYLWICSNWGFKNVAWSTGITSYGILYEYLPANAEDYDELNRMTVKCSGKSAASQTYNPNSQWPPASSTTSGTSTEGGLGDYIPGGATTAPASSWPEASSEIDDTLYSTGPGEVQGYEDTLELAD